MENQKNNKIQIILLLLFGILIFILGCFGGYFFYDKLNNNTYNDVNNNTVNQTDNIDEIVIDNTEIKELYNYTQASLNSNYVCLGYFYQNPFKNHSLIDKINLVIINYGKNYQKEIDDEFLLKINEEDRELVRNSSEYYVDANAIKKGLKLIFNIDIDNFDENENYYWDYRKNIDAFISISGGGDYDGEIIQRIIDYKELDNEINLTVVKAEILTSPIMFNNGEKTLPTGIYRVISNENSLVYENMSKDDFKFTRENIDKFPQIKYVFKKNDNGNYYVNDIINLNYEEDYVACE